jgi:thioredoxin 1
MLKMLKFSAPWCGPCRQLKNVIAGVELDMPNVKFQEVDVDDDPETARQYRVSSIPTLVVLKDGREVDRKVGMQTRQTLIDWLKDLTRDA